MKLFESGKIGELEIKNRIIMAAMGHRLIEFDGRLSQRGIDFYVARAKGGTGLIITSGARAREVDKAPFTPVVDNMVIDAKACVGPLNDLAEAVHDYGARVAVGVTPGQGRNVSDYIVSAGGAVAPSAVPTFADPAVTTRALTTEEVGRATQAFQFIAEMIRTAGIDAIEINAHAGYLIDQFITPLWNKRNDAYGGNLDGRLMFIREIISHIKKGAGDDFPIIVKFNVTHYLPEGRDIDEGLEIARRLEGMGIAALEIDAGCYETIYWVFPPNTLAPGCMVDLAEKVKKSVKIPVIAVGRLQYPELAERILLDGKADFIALGRGLLADPEWPNKVKNGEADDICPCVGDLEGCLRRIWEGKSISCTVNPMAGAERKLSIDRAARKRFVLVAGGGPAGMEAAMIAAMKGHKVILCEKSNTLGGNLIPGSVPDFKKDYLKLVSYLSSQIKKQGVEVRLATEVTPALIEGMEPEVVFVATGSVPIIPGIPGAGGDNVATAIDVLMARKKVAESAIVVGGGSVGCETALHLALNGKRVTVIESLDSVARDIYKVNRLHLSKLLEEASVLILTDTTVLEIIETGVIAVNSTGKISTFDADTVVLAAGLIPNTRLLESLLDRGIELHAIGDCVQPGSVMKAIREAFRIARLL